MLHAAETRINQVFFLQAFILQQYPSIPTASFKKTNENADEQDQQQQHDMNELNPNL